MTDEPRRQVEHPAETIETAAAVRELIARLRVADAPPEVLAEAAALAREASTRLEPYAVHDDKAGQSHLRTVPFSGDGFSMRRPAEFFPYSSVVGPMNPVAPPIALDFDGTTVSGAVTLGEVYAGPPGAVHGGIIALIFDELLGVVNVLSGVGAFTGTLSIRYERFTPIREELELSAHVDRTEGKKVFTVGTISAGGAVTARAEGIFIQVGLDRLQ
jgi:acyl-coenzyme A thioesterase PaaI-like protein